MGSLCQNIAKDDSMARITSSNQQSFRNQIFNARQQIYQLPTASNTIQQKINKYSKHQPHPNPKIWKIKSPFNFIYQIGQGNPDNHPVGKCTIFKLKQNSQQFGGYFQGKIQQDGTINLKQSIVIFPNGSHLIGTDKNKGIYENEKTGLKYEGGWYKETPHGEGIQTTTKGVYEGQFVNGKKSGKGKFVWAEKSTYQGQFLNGYMHGKGVYVNSKDNYKYEGQFKNGQFHGQGKFICAEHIYDGNFQYGNKQGKGKLTYKNQLYEGQFQQDLPHGKGTFTNLRGNTAVGVWQAGKIVCVISSS